MKKLENQYKEETGKNAYDTSNECEGVNTGTYYTQYVEWLEQKLVNKNDLLPLVSVSVCDCFPAKPTVSFATGLDHCLKCGKDIKQTKL